MYHYKGGVTVGQVNRFNVELDASLLRTAGVGEQLSVKIKNTTSALMRPAFLAGPYILYISVREDSYRPEKVLADSDFVPHFDANLKTNCSRWQSLPLPQVGQSTADAEKTKRQYVIDIISQVIFSPSAKVSFEFTIGMDKSHVRSATRAGKPIECQTPGLRVELQNTEMLWDMPPIPRDRIGHHIPADLPVESTHCIKGSYNGEVYDHLVVLTHGIHSNLTSDMLYVKELIESKAKEQGQNVICKGFAGNTCNTERGVKWLGKRLGQWVLRETGWKFDQTSATRNKANPYKKISFIAHSLGGLVQIFALGYVYDKTFGKFFAPTEGLEPINFITLATPLLGISAENPAYVKLALDFGLVGKTGQDLALSFKPLGEYTVRDPREITENNSPVSPTTPTSPSETRVRDSTPLLRLMSAENSPCHQAIALFRHRTVYANIENDGIVPLRTSSLFFLDWEDFHLRKRERSRASNPTSPSEELESMSLNYGSPTTRSALASPQSEVPPMSSEATSSYIATAVRQGDEVLPADISTDEEVDVDEMPHALGSFAANANNSANLETKPASARRPVTEATLPETLPANTASVKDSSDLNTVPREGSPASNANQGDTTATKSIQDTVSGMLGTRSTNVDTKFTTNPESKIAQDSIEGPMQSPVSPVTPKSASSSSSDLKSSVKQASGPSDSVENASHSNNSLLSLLFPSQSQRKPSKAFTRSQTLASSRSAESEEKIELEEPSRTSFFKSLESILNPPMPDANFLRDPSLRDPPQDVIVHDKLYRPSDIPPLKELPTKRPPIKHQSHHARKTEEKERVRLEKIKLEEKIARGWHSDMSWRKVLVKLKPDAHNNIVVRRMFANSYGWPVVDHLVEQHFGNTKQQDAGEAREEPKNPVAKDWNSDLLRADSDDEATKTH